MEDSNSSTDFHLINSINTLFFKTALTEIKGKGHEIVIFTMQIMPKELFKLRN